MMEIVACHLYGVSIHRGEHGLGHLHHAKGHGHHTVSVALRQPRQTPHHHVGVTYGLHLTNQETPPPLLKSLKKVYGGYHGNKLYCKLCIEAGHVLVSQMAT